MAKTSAAYKQEKIEDIQKVLAELPKVATPKPDFDLKATIGKLSKDIKGLQKKGYTVDAIAEVLTKNGIEITSKTLRTYMSKSKPRTKKK